MRGTLKYNEPLAPHTSWHIGGPVATYYKPADVEDLSEFLKTLPADEPLTWLGLGSNVLIHDDGLPGTLIHTQGALNEIEIHHDENKLYVKVQAGVSCAKLAKACAKAGYAKGAFFAGIPGTIGGALTMNAGAFGNETWNHVIAVETINRFGERSIRTPKAYQVAYRSVKGIKSIDEWFISGTFVFERDETEEAAAAVIKQLLRKRSETQPIGLFSCGSVFRNPPGDFAARLIESCGLKGFNMGDAQISPKHANFIINVGNALATETLELIQHIQETVYAEYQIQLKTEVRLLGF